MNRIVFVIVFIAILLLIDVYAYQLYRTVFADKSSLSQVISKVFYWSCSAIVFGGLALFLSGGYASLSPGLRTFFQGSLLVIMLPKLLLAVFALFDDVIRLIKWVVAKTNSAEATEPVQGQSISRSEFISQTGLALATVPFVGMSYGIISGAHDYRIRRLDLMLENLPAAFDGMTLAQISDIHSGSFWNKRAVAGGVDMLNAEKPDMVFFTGDLVNDKSSEMNNWGELFSRISAPHGVYAVLGNHDYGDYVSWPSVTAKRKNLEDLIAVERNMGWELLLDENRIIEIDGEKIAVIGIENWGAKGRFPQYGNLRKALVGTEEVNTKLLLSHDPSHWRAQVIPEFGEIDAMFAGHTHGAQFGIETANWKWSPVQLMYDEWAGLYKEGKQQLYVNRGYGYIGYPGRLGILPEITIFTLKRKPIS